MARRQQLSETQLAELFDPPAEQRELVRHFTLPPEDLAAAQRCARLAVAPTPNCLTSCSRKPLKTTSWPSWPGW